MTACDCERCRAARDATPLRACPRASIDLHLASVLELVTWEGERDILIGRHIVAVQRLLGLQSHPDVKPI